MLNKVYIHKSVRILYYSLSLFILFLSMYKISTSALVFYMEDYIFLSILALSFIILNKYSIVLKETTLNFNDFIIIVCYIKFNIYLTILIIFLGYSITFLIEYKQSKKLNLLTENIFIFNTSLIILSAFISHLVLQTLDGIYYIKTYESISLIIYSVVLLLTNYGLFCFEISVQKWELTLITLENGLYYVLINFMACTVVSVFAVYLHSLYGYMPIAAITSFIIFTSLSLNSLDNYRKKNRNLNALTECTTFTISKADFKIKLQNAVRTIEHIAPFVYCGIYLVRENYSALYPVCHKCNSLISVEDVRFNSSDNNAVYKEIIDGELLYRESSYFNSCLPLVQSYSDKIKYAAVVPIKDFTITTGFIVICFDRHLNIEEELKLISTLGNHIGMVNYHLSTNIKGNLLSYKNYDSLTRYIDYNIKYKIFYTLALIEIKNYDELTKRYNSDFYESYIVELEKFIEGFLCEKDKLIFFEKETIYISFGLLDSKNSQEKLREIEAALDSFSFNNLSVKTRISWSCSEYPVDGVSADEILANVYRKLKSEKSA